MRIGIISPYSLTVPGGVQGQVLALARVLRSKGHETRVLGPCDGPPPDAGVTPLGNSLPTAANGSIAPIAPDASAQLRLIRALRDESFDVLHLHEPMAPGPTTTTLLLRPAPIVGTFHAAGSSKAYRWLRPGVRAIARRMDIRCAVSEDARLMAEAALGGTYRVLYNGIDVPRVQAAVPSPTTGPTIFFIGRHEPRKGLSVLLRAMVDLPAETRLWIAGEGPETRSLRAQVAGDPRITWLGRISDDEKLSRLRGAHVLCAPSLGGESFGIVLIEGMAAGAAVVASDLPGYAHVARDGVDASLVPPGDPRALAAALTVVLLDADVRGQQVQRAAARAEHFSMDRLADAYLALYAEARSMAHSRR